MKIKADVGTVSVFAIPAERQGYKEIGVTVANLSSPTATHLSSRSTWPRAAAR